MSAGRLDGIFIVPVHTYIHTSASSSSNVFSLAIVVTITSISDDNSETGDVVGNVGYPATFDLAYLGERSC